MSLFAIADLHLSLGEDKPMDIFAGWNDYVDRLSENWHKLVRNDDTVVIAGDISWAMKLEETYTDFKFIHDLPGKKILLKGNHDYWWGTKSKIDAFLENNGLTSISVLFNNAYVCGEYVLCGTRGWFLENDTPEDIKVLNREVGRLRMSLDQAVKTGLEPVVFLHYPPYYRGIECKEIMDVLLEYNIRNCYYGHIHGKKNFKLACEGEYKGINFHLISCDKVGFMPVLVR
ncbi:MAG: metallophosphoesterase [Ruminococcus sp.]|nr:metallophosphoesterase [Ruminococcus sp.]